ncbi:MAG: hypothetical protein WCJ64_08750 [Rhodospirillaceae bacterium]
MGRLTLSWRNWADGGALSGGSWLSACPLTNLQDRALSRVSRSVNATTAATQISFDLGQMRVLQLVGLARHTLTVAGRWRVVFGSAAGLSDLFDSGWLQAWPSRATAQMHWEDDQWFYGTPQQDDASGYSIDAWMVTPSTRCRYGTIYLDDHANSLGYVDLSRLWVGDSWSPPTNYDRGAELDWEPNAQLQYSIGRAIFSNGAPSTRMFSLKFSRLDEVDAYGRMMELRRIARNDGEVVVIPDPDDSIYGYKRNMMARIRQSDRIKQAAGLIFSHGLEFEELR